MSTGATLTGINTL